MCGIFGLVEASTSGLFSSDQKIIFGMSLLTSLRGSDSTGFFGVNTRRDFVDVMKVVGTPYEWNNYKASDEFMKRVVNDYNLVVGHGRLSTIGKTIAKNAHPFTHGKITMVHNGTLSNFQTLQKKHNTNFEVDSELVCYLLDKIGVEETVEEIEGAYTLVWWDKSDSTINLMRNTQRPLVYAISENKKRLLFASESPVVAFGAAMHKTDKFKQIFELPVYKQFKAKVKGTQYNDEISFEEIKREKKTYFSFGTSYSPGSYRGTYGGYGEDGYWDNFPRSNYKRPDSKPSEKSTPKTIICLNEDVQFILKDYDELETQQGDKKVFLLHGTVDSNPHLEVVGKFFGTEFDLEAYIDVSEKAIFYGKVNAIRWIGELSGACRIFVDKAEPFKESTKQVETFKYVPSVPSHVNVVKLLGSNMSANKFIHISSKGCHKCQAELPYEKSESFLSINYYDDKLKQRNDGLLCPDCTNIELQIRSTVGGKSVA